MSRKGINVPGIAKVGLLFGKFLNNILMKIRKEPRKIRVPKDMKYVLPEEVEFV